MDDFGGKLRQARERRGISLRQIASSTKIAAAALDALEKNDISKLPGGIFSRAFVRSYAVAVGLDPDETVKEFLERFNQEPPPSAEAMAAAIPEEEKQFEHRQRQAAKALGFGVTLVVILIVIVFFAFRKRPVPPEAAPAPAAISSPALAPAPVPEPTPPPADAGAPSATAPLAGQLKLEIRPVAECWVSLTVDGRKLFARVIRPGERESTVVQREAIVEVGDAGAFAFSVNGRPGKPLGDKGQVKTLKLTPSTFAQYLK
jgi:cytoskeleton protein RodZ